jgi:hypothetical protein
MQGKEGGGREGRRLEMRGATYMITLRDADADEGRKEG